MTTPRPEALTRPPTPPRRRCIVSVDGVRCEEPPRYPNRDESSFCATHDNAANPETVAFLTRRSTPRPEHAAHHGNHAGYACGFAGPHCWACGEPWPCRTSRQVAAPPGRPRLISLPPVADRYIPMDAASSDEHNEAEGHGGYTFDRCPTCHPTDPRLRVRETDHA